jgi:riboflavin biosynthesis pyrimidine reductase
VTTLRPTAISDVDADDIYFDVERPAPADRPWLLVNMIATVDGATSIGDVSGPLGNDDDRRVLRLLRACADVILVAAGTVRAEGYRAPRIDEHHRARRRAEGRPETPRLAIVSASLDLDATGPPFSDARDDARPIVVTSAASDAARRNALAGVADVILAGDRRVDLRQALEQLAGTGAGVVLCEGGPSLNGQLVAAGLVDELCTTVSPRLVGGPSPRLAHGDAAAATPTDLTLAHAVTSGELLFLRYVRSGAPPTNG